MVPSVTVQRPRYTYLLAVAGSAAGLAAMMLALLYFQLPRTVGVVLSLAVPFVLGAAFGAWRPGPGRLLALCVSSAFVFYFGAVFAALTYNSDRDWLVAFLTAGTLAAGWLGVLAGGRAARLRDGAGIGNTPAREGTR